MKKQIIPTAAFAACLALCAAVWPQKQPAEETPALPTPAAVIATQPEVPEIAEMEEVIPPEEEKAEATLQELVEETDIVPEPSPAQAPPESEVQSPSEQDAALLFIYPMIPILLPFSYISSAYSAWLGPWLSIQPKPGT